MPTQILSRNWKRRKKNKPGSDPEPEAEPGAEAIASLRVESRHSIDDSTRHAVEPPELVAAEPLLEPEPKNPEPANPEPAEPVRVAPTADPGHAAQQIDRRQEPDPHRLREQAGVADEPEEAPPAPPAAPEAPIAREDDAPVIEVPLTERPSEPPEAPTDAGLDELALPEAPPAVTDNRVEHDVPDDDMRDEALALAEPGLEEVHAESAMAAETTPATEMVTAGLTSGAETGDGTAQELLADDAIPESGAVIEREVPPADPETVLDEETMETFESLAEILVERREPGGDPDLSGSDNVAGSGEFVVTVAPEAGEDHGMGFEAYVAAQETSRAVPELEEVIGQTVERTPEETFADLARLLGDDEVRGTGAPERMAAVREALREADGLIRQSTGMDDPLEALEPEADVVKDELEPTTITVTPELTDKLLVLLRTIGHDNPRETLVGLVSRRGFTFLAEAVTHLQRLSDDAGRLELSQAWLQPHMAEATAPSPTLTTRLGRTLVALIVAPAWFETQHPRI
ncbi:MAG TPA: hypothetical protein VFX84_02100 [Candidatus Saccharimonadales bacterium]|nr:hypothetical protein [Candidatus Saccharimonadales bacterium]